MYLVASKYNSKNFIAPCYNTPTPFLFLLQLKVQVEFTLEQAMKALSESRSYHYSFFKLWARLGGGGGQCHAPAALLLVKRPGTHCTCEWVSLTAGPDGCGKSGHHWDSMPGPSSS